MSVAVQDVQLGVRTSAGSVPDRKQLARYQNRQNIGDFPD